MGMQSRCNVTRNSFSVRPQMAGKANLRQELSWAVGQGMMETDTGVAVPFLTCLCCSAAAVLFASKALAPRLTAPDATCLCLEPLALSQCT